MIGCRVTGDESKEISLVSTSDLARVLFRGVEGADDVEGEEDVTGEGEERGLGRRESMCGAPRIIVGSGAVSLKRCICSRLSISVRRS